MDLQKQFIQEILKELNFIQGQLGQKFQVKNDEYGQIMNSALSNFLTDMVSDVKNDRKMAAVLGAQSSGQSNLNLLGGPGLPSRVGIF